MCKTISVSEKTKNKNKKSPQTLSPQTPKYLKYLSFSFFSTGKYWEMTRVFSQILEIQGKMVKLQVNNLIKNQFLFLDTILMFN